MRRIQPLMICLSVALPTLLGIVDTPLWGDSRAACEPDTPPAGVSQFIVDMNSATTVGARHYKLNDQVQIVIRNKNPFLYRYRIQIDEIELPEDALSLITGLLKSDAIEEPEKETTAPTEESPSRDTMTFEILRTEDCRNLRDAREKLEIGEAARNLSNQEEKVDGILKSLTEAIQQRRNGSRSLKGSLVEKNATCEQIAGSVMKLAETESLSADLSALEKEVGELGKLITIYEVRLEDFADELNRLEDICPENQINLARKSAKDTHDRAQKAITKFQEEISAKKTAVDELSEERRTILNIINNRNNFVSTTVVGKYSQRTQVTVRIWIKEIDDKDFPKTPEIEEELFFGRPRFAAAVGAAFSGLQTTKYDVVRGFEADQSGELVLDDNGDRNLTNVVGLKEDSDERVTPMVIFHTRIGEGDSIFSGYHLSFGLTGNLADGGVDVEYLAGVSFSFAEERFFVTLGGYNGRVQSLQQGFYVGRALGDDLSSVPVREDREWSWVVGLSYKFR